jgi:GMP synthase (glutamine-hydrolysing)
MTKKYIGIIQTGTAIASARDKFGDFDQWFINTMQTTEHQTQTYRVFEELTFPASQNLAGIIITGSSAMVTQELDWSEATIDWLKPLLDKNIPILGVCYGHQLLAKLLGGKVDWNPKGREIGQVKLSFTANIQDDALFKPLIQVNSNPLNFLATHQQSVTQLPDNVALLGTTALDPNHAFRYQSHIWGLQFHPEFNLEIITQYIQARADDLLHEGLNPQQLIKALEENNNGKQLLKQSKDICFSA